MNILQGKEISSSDRRRVKEQAKFNYCPLGKVFEKEIKTIKNQDEKQLKITEEHRKQLAESTSLFKKIWFWLWKR